MSGVARTHGEDTRRGAVRFRGPDGDPACLTRIGPTNALKGLGNQSISVRRRSSALLSTHRVLQEAGVVAVSSKQVAALEQRTF